MRASDRAYAALREEIMEGTLAPGVMLAENEQSERLGVSRTPVREALSRLLADGLAAQAPGRGTVVSEISLADVDQLFEVRIPLEAQAAGLAALRRRPEPFHELAAEFDAARAGADPQSYYRLAARMDAAIDETLGNPYLSSMLAGLRVHLGRIRRLAQDQPQRLVESATEHRDICAAIAAGDPDMAEAATRLHLLRSLHYISAQRSLTTDDASRSTDTRKGLVHQ